MKKMPNKNIEVGYVHSLRLAHIQWDLYLKFQRHGDHFKSRFEGRVAAEMLWMELAFTETCGRHTMCIIILTPLSPNRGLRTRQ